MDLFKDILPSIAPNVLFQYEVVKYSEVIKEGKVALIFPTLVNILFVAVVKLLTLVLIVSAYRKTALALASA